jgi:hypothetical protein
MDRRRSFSVRSRDETANCSMILLVGTNVPLPAWVLRPASPYHSVEYRLLDPNCTGALDDADYPRSVMEHSELVCP